MEYVGEKQKAETIQTSFISTVKMSVLDVRENIERMTRSDWWILTNLVIGLGNGSCF